MTNQPVAQDTGKPTVEDLVREMEGLCPPMRPASMQWEDAHYEKQKDFIRRIQQDALSASKPDADVERLREALIAFRKFKASWASADYDREDDFIRMASLADSMAELALAALGKDKI